MKAGIVITCSFILGCSTHGQIRSKVKIEEPPELNARFKGANVIMVSLDALQAGHVHALGYPKDVTPVIDRLMRENYNFTNAVSVSSWTVPASMSWFTGVLPSQHKVVNKFSFYDPPRQIPSRLKELSPNLITLAEILKEQGYATAAFTGGAGVSGIFGFNRGFDRYVDDVKFGSMEYTVPKALQWLKDNKDKKFFLFLHGYDVHGQCEPSEGFDYRYVSRGYDGTYTGSKKEQEALREEGLTNGKVELRQEDVDFWRAVYDEKINRLDRKLGEFLREVDDLGLMRNTILCVTSDHGTEVYEHQRFDHGFSLYEELIHVPLLIKVPAGGRGRQIGDQVSSIDIMPTILELLQIELSPVLRSQLRGISLVEAMRARTVSREVYSETDYRRYTYKRALRTSDGWKFIYTLESGEKELYNLRNDPGERNNLAEKEARLAYELEQRLFAYFKSMGRDLSGNWETGCYPVYDSQAPR